MTYTELVEKARELDKLGQFNLKKLDLNRAIIAEEKDNEKIAELNGEVKNLYEAIVSDPLMIAYSTTKDELDNTVRFIMQIIQGSANGDNPYEIEEQSCGGDCSACGGCH